MSDVEDIKGIFKRYRWAVDELVYDQKLQEATELSNGKNQLCYDYLLRRYGSTREVVAMLKALIRLQDGPRKALAARKDK